MLLAGPIVLDLSTVHFSHFSGCWASFVYSCHSILECYNLFSGVRFSTRSFCFQEKGCFGGKNCNNRISSVAYKSWFTGCMAVIIDSF